MTRGIASATVCAGETLFTVADTLLRVAGIGNEMRGRVAHAPVGALHKVLISVAGTLAINFFGAVVAFAALAFVRVPTGRAFRYAPIAIDYRASLALLSIRGQGVTKLAMIAGRRGGAALITTAFMAIRNTTLLTNTGA
jgi:hypothetical protein